MVKKLGSSIRVNLGIKLALLFLCLGLFQSKAFADSDPAQVIESVDHRAAFLEYTRPDVGRGTFVIRYTTLPAHPKGSSNFCTTACALGQNGKTSGTTTEEGFTQIENSWVDGGDGIIGSVDDVRLNSLGLTTTSTYTDYETALSGLGLDVNDFILYGKTDSYGSATIDNYDYYVDEYGGSLPPVNETGVSVAFPGVDIRSDSYGGIVYEGSVPSGGEGDGGIFGALTDFATLIAGWLLGVISDNIAILLTVLSGLLLVPFWLKLVKFLQNYIRS